MANTLAALKTQIESSGANVKIYDYTDHLLTFGKDDCLCVVRVHMGTMCCDVSKAIKKTNPGLDDYRRVNDLTSVTQFGKHYLKYNTEKRNYNYCFGLEFDLARIDLIETVQYAVRAFAIAYDIVNLEDERTAYRRIEAYTDALSM